MNNQMEFFSFEMGFGLFVEADASQQ